MKSFHLTDIYPQIVCSRSVYIGAGVKVLLRFMHPAAELIGIFEK